MNYKELLTYYNINVDKCLNDDLAALTHYWQNKGTKAEQLFEKHAKTFLKEIAPDKELDFIPSYSDIKFPPPEKPAFTFIDLFAGIGGIRMAYQNAGGKCVFSSEWNNYAKKTYQDNFGEVPFGDITKIKASSIPTHDILLAGFPCQPFSIAGVSKKNALGKKHGFLDETQGTLFFDIARIIKSKKPKAFMLENVKNLKSHDKKRTFKVIKNTLEELGYTVYEKILDGKNYVPQHRERIIIVGFRNTVYKNKEIFNFPVANDSNKRMKDILESGVEAKFTLTDKLWEYLQGYAAKHKSQGNGFGYGLVDLNGISRTISARYYKDGAEILIPQTGNPRRLTPREAARLQGFPDNFNIPVSDTQAYKQFGNSVTVPLIEAVALELVKAIKKRNESKPTKKRI